MPPSLGEGKMPSPLESSSLTDQSYEMTAHKISKDTSHSHLQVLEPDEITYLATQGVCTSLVQCKMLSSTPATIQAIAIQKNVCLTKTMGKMDQSY